MEKNQIAHEKRNFSIGQSTIADVTHTQASVSFLFQSMEIT